MTERTARAAHGTWRRLGAPTLSHTILLLGSLAMMFPFVWMLATSLKPADETLLWPPRLLPIHWTVANYPVVLNAAPFVRYFLNSVIVSVGSTIMVIATSCFAQGKAEKPSGIELTIYNLPAVLDGNLDGLLEPLMAHDLEDRLAVAKL